VMNRLTSFDSRKVDARECTAFRLGASAVDFSMPGPASAVEVTTATVPPADIRDFVRQFFMHGIPYEETIIYGSHAVPTLLDMLADPREEQAWPNIVVVLGMLGDERAVTPLISLIERGSREVVNYSEYEAKKNAIFGLGYLINKTAHQEAFNYLRDGLTPTVWSERGVTWISPDHETAAERDRELSRMTIIGLGLSGDPAGEEALRELLTSALTLPEREFREQMSGVISEALKANQRIAEEGLAEYYRRAPP
jgi:hypothetical protein